MRLLQLALRQVLVPQDVERKQYDDNDVDHGELKDVEGGLIVLVKNDVPDMMVRIGARHANWTERSLHSSTVEHLSSTKACIAGSNRWVITEA